MVKYVQNAYKMKVVSLVEKIYPVVRRADMLDVKNYYRREREQGFPDMCFV